MSAINCSRYSSFPLVACFNSSNASEVNSLSDSYSLAIDSDSEEAVEKLVEPDSESESLKDFSSDNASERLVDSESEFTTLVDSTFDIESESDSLKESSSDKAPERLVDSESELEILVDSTTESDSLAETSASLNSSDVLIMVLSTSDTEVLVSSEKDS